MVKEIISKRPLFSASPKPESAKRRFGPVEEVILQNPKSDSGPLVAVMVSRDEGA